MVSEITNITARIISRLYGNGNVDKATLASLRGAENIESPRARTIWPIMFSEINEKYLSHDPTGKPSNTENAIYTAIRCYAIYQQGVNDEVYASSYGDKANGEALFRSLSKIRGTGTSRDALDRRVQNLLSSRNISSVTKSVTQLVRIIKSNNPKMKIDFGQLAADLYYFSVSFNSANQVCLKWGQQYYWVANSSDDENEKRETKND